MENETETGGKYGFKEFDLGYCIGETSLVAIYTHNSNLS